MKGERIGLVFLLCAVFGAVTGKFVPQENLDDETEGELWAVLVAGSKDFYDYRHQADVCHAFQNLVSHGVPESNIIVMMYDDIANHSENPTKGVIVNQPYGPDVYHGVPKDYTGREVTPENFMKVLLGDSELEKQGKKVLKSGPKDRVFIYLADHGEKLVFFFPDDVLYAIDLITTLKKMHEKQKYSNLVLYMEACYSGSIFDGLLPENISVYAVTAATPNQISYVCFWDDVRKTFLGDQFSINFLLDADIGRPFGEKTLQQQFLKIKNATTNSQPQQYGDLNITKLPITQFFGSKVPPERKNPYTKCDSQVASNEVPLEVMRRRIAKASAEEKLMLVTEYQGMLRARDYLKQTVRKIAEDLCAKGHCGFTNQLFTEKSLPITRHRCAQRLIKTFHRHCFDLARNTYATRHLRVFVNIAESLGIENLDRKCQAIETDLKSACYKHRHQNREFFERII